jgi:hypothetical protein
MTETRSKRHLLNTDWTEFIHICRRQGSSLLLAAVMESLTMTTKVYGVFTAKRKLWKDVFQISSLLFRASQCPPRLFIVDKIPYLVKITHLCYLKTYLRMNLNFTQLVLSCWYSTPVKYGVLEERSFKALRAKWCFLVLLFQ